MFVPAITADSTIGIIAPASPVSAQKREIAIERFTQFGYSIQLGKSVTATYGYLSGNDDLRVDDIHHMFGQSEIDAIFCLRGGYGTMRLLDRLDYAHIASNPKPFVGYSDITALHLAIHQQTNMVTFHGPMVAEARKDESTSSWEQLFCLLQGIEPLPCYQSENRPLCFTAGQAVGKLVGGNLTLITATLGTPFEIDTTGNILLLEDVNEAPYAIDRMLTQLLLAGKLQQTVGIVFTSCHKCHAPSGKSSLTFEEVLADRLTPLAIPAFYGLSIGHRYPNYPIPLGCHALIDAASGTLQITEQTVY